MEPTRYTQDDSQWPIVIAQPPPECTEEAFQAYLDGQEVALKRGRHVLVVDGRAGRMMSSAMRRRLAAWIKENHDRLKLRRKGLALVSDSAVVRGFLTATYWITPPPYPFKSFAALAEAIAWGHELMAAAEKEAG